MKLKIITLLLALLTGVSSAFSYPVSVEAAEIPDLVFPVLGGAEYRNDFGDPRVGGRKHEGNDLMNKKMTPLLAAVDGEISFITSNEATWGWSLSITDKNGYEYNYLHLNNDTEGTDDGAGGYNNAFAKGIKLGVKVKRGELVGYLGDSGNAETTLPHLHFEIRKVQTGEPINPYQYLQSADVLTAPVAGSKKKTTTKKTKVDKSEIIPFDNFEGGANLGRGNLDSDSDMELIVGTAFGGGGKSELKILDGNGKTVKSFSAFEKSFTGGVDVATSDINADGVAEVIVGSGPGIESTVKVFKANGDLITSFIPYPKFTGGVRVASDDINGDGKPEIVTAPSSGGGPHVKIYDSAGKLQKELMVYSPKFTGGVDVATFAPSGSFAGGFVVAPGPGGGPHVKTYNYDLKLVGEFMAYPASFSGGVRVDSGNFVQNNGSFEVVTVPASNSSGNTKIYKTNGELLKSSSTSFEESWTGGFDVVFIGESAYIVSSGGRKTSIKKVTF